MKRCAGGNGDRHQPDDRLSPGQSGGAGAKNDTGPVPRLLRLPGLHRGEINPLKKRDCKKFVYNNMTFIEELGIFKNLHDDTHDTSI